MTTRRIERAKASIYEGSKHQRLSVLLQVNTSKSRQNLGPFFECGRGLTKQRSAVSTARQAA